MGAAGFNDPAVFPSTPKGFADEAAQLEELARRSYSQPPDTIAEHGAAGPQGPAVSFSRRRDLLSLTRRTMRSTRPGLSLDLPGPLCYSTRSLRRAYSSVGRAADS